MTDYNITANHEQEFLEDSKVGRFILSIGSKGSGKTYLMTNYLKYCIANNLYKNIVFVCPCYEGEANNSYSFLKNQNHILIYTHYSEKVSIKVDALRRKGSTLFLIDDASGELLKQMDKTIIQLITTTRHFEKCTIFIALHSARRILSPIVRQNVDSCFIYKIINMKLLADLHEEFFSQYFDKFSDFKRWYLDATNEKYSAIHFSIHMQGIDVNVKNWTVQFNQPEVFKPTKALIKKKVVSPKAKQSSIRFLFSRKRF